MSETSARAWGLVMLLLAGCGGQVDKGGSGGSGSGMTPEASQEVARMTVSP